MHEVSPLIGSDSMVAGLNGSIDRLPDYRDPVKLRVCAAIVRASPKHCVNALAD
jgi:hypothetical protein